MPAAARACEPPRPRHRATGTGKTISLQTLAESFSRIGVPVFMADVKGDLTGISQSGKPGEKLLAILRNAAWTLPPQAAARRHCGTSSASRAIRCAPPSSDMGPLLLSRMLSLNDTQQGVLQLVFKIADDAGLLLLDLKDLRAMLQHVGDNASTYQTQYGNVSAASIGAIQRGLMAVETPGGDKFFGEPMLNIADLMQTEGGKGVINILAADKLMAAPLLYATFLLWMLSELFETLPEVGRPRETQAGVLLRRGASAVQGCAGRADRPDRTGRPPGALEGRRRLLRDAEPAGHSPMPCSASWATGVQHALRAFTPRDQKAVKAAAETMRAKPGLDIATAITELAVGEALVSLLDEKGRPSVTRARLRAAAGQPDRADHRRAAVGAAAELAGGRHL